MVMFIQVNNNNLFQFIKPTKETKLTNTYSTTITRVFHLKVKIYFIFSYNLK